MTPLPPRIWIVGPCGSGKSTLADVLAARLGAGAVHVDDLFWNPGWVGSSDDELRARVDAATAGPRWVADGNYARIGRPLRDRADLVVWLDLPFPVTFTRVLIRTLRRRVRRETCCNGNRESLRTAFFSRESILLWSIRTRFTLRYDYATELASLPHVRLRSRREVAAFLAGVSAS